jgi:hypothetical protein
MKRFVATVLFLLALAISARADLTAAATLVIQEFEPSRFTVELTLPVVNGRVVKARPVLPDICILDGEPEVRGDVSRAIRTWTMTCEPEALEGAAIGIHGLLGTTLGVDLSFETLDGRRHACPLRPTQAYFVVPSPPTTWELVAGAGRSGTERLLRRIELALLLLGATLLGARWRALLLATAAFAAAQGLGQWLGAQNWMVMSLFLPRLAAACVAWLLGVELMGRPLLRPGWLQPLWVPLLVLGLLYGAALPETIPTEGLSTTEQGQSLLFFAAGALVGLLLLALTARQLELALAGGSSGAGRRWSSRAGCGIAVVAGGLALWCATGPNFGAVVTPTIPAVAFASAAALGLLCRRHDGAGMALAVGAAGAAGVFLSFHASLPLASQAVFGLLALVGVGLLSARRWPLGLVLPVVAATAIYQGHHAGELLRRETTLPLANVVGLGVLLSAVFLFCYRSGGAGAGAARPVGRWPGLMILLLAGLWQLAEHTEWVSGPVAADLAMGVARVPVPALLLLALAWIAWPRRRRFSVQPGAGAGGLHRAMLGLAFFLIPLGGLRVDIPFHAPDAPSATEAGRVMDALLTDTYLAFNLEGEDAAFDRLALNLSQDLVASVYLDSRRRLTAGTREGAEVTVLDVSVMDVDEAVSTTQTSFTYPCQWVVTARVRHLLHVHNRKNVYAGELTIRVEDDRWKIAGLELFSEERVILSWTQS